MHGTRNEHDEVHIVKDYEQWSDLPNRDTNNPNGMSFYFPRFEFFCQKLNFLLSTTLIKVIERLAVLSIIVTFFGWLLGFWDIDISSDSDGS